MELKGKPGEEVWVKAQVNFVQIGLEGVSYFVDIEGQLVQFPESAVSAVSVPVDPETVKREELKGYSIMDPTEALGITKEYPGIKCDILEPPEMPAVKPEAPEEPEEAPAPRRRGRPKKATVEGLMAKAEQARIRNEADTWQEQI